MAQAENDHSTDDTAKPGLIDNLGLVEDRLNQLAPIVALLNGIDHEKMRRDDLRDAIEHLATSIAERHSEIRNAVDIAKDQARDLKRIAERIRAEFPAGGVQ